MKKYLFFISLLFIYSPSSAQYEKKGVIIEDRLLTWDDFKGRNESSSFTAQTSTAIQLLPRQVNFADPIPDYKAVCYFLPRESSVSSKFLREQPDSIKNHVLNHEQGHYYLARTATAEINATFQKFEFNQRRSVIQADSIYRSIYARLRNTQMRYDTETNHSENYPDQAQWDTIILNAVKAGKLPE